MGGMLQTSPPLFLPKWPKSRVKQTWRNGVGRIKGRTFPVLFSFQKTRRTPQSPTWLPRQLRQYWLNIGLSVLDFPGECISLFVMAMGEGDFTSIIPRFFERIS